MYVMGAICIETNLETEKETVWGISNGFCMQVASSITLFGGHEWQNQP